MTNLQKAEEIRKAGEFTSKGNKLKFLSYTAYEDGWVSLMTKDGKFYDIEEVE